MKKIAEKIGAVLAEQIADDSVTAHVFTCEQINPQCRFADKHKKPTYFISVVFKKCIDFNDVPQIFIDMLSGAAEKIKETKDKGVSKTCNF